MSGSSQSGRLSRSAGGCHDASHPYMCNQYSSHIRLFPTPGAAGAASVYQVGHAERVRSAQLVGGIYKFLPLVREAVLQAGSKTLSAKAFAMRCWPMRFDTTMLPIGRERSCPPPRCSDG